MLGHQEIESAGCAHFGGQTFHLRSFMHLLKVHYRDFTLTSNPATRTALNSSVDSFLFICIYQIQLEVIFSLGGSELVLSVIGRHLNSFLLAF
jgi:hypothetical protein